MKTIKKVYGPYLDKAQGRLFVTIIYTDGTRKSTSVAKHLMEQTLGRELDPVLETVDHVDGDPLNNCLENLQILTMEKNIQKSSTPTEMGDFVCPQCGVHFQRAMREIRHHQGKRGRAGPFCGKSCAGQYGTDIQKQNKSGLIP